MNEKGQNKSGKGGRKRPRTTTTTEGSQENCLVCELHHKLPNCFYVFEEKAFEGFKPREKIQKRVEENLKKKEVIDAVNKLKNKKPR